MLPNTKAGLLLAAMAGFASLAPHKLSGKKSKPLIGGGVSKEEQQRRIQSAQEKRERKNAARLHRLTTESS